MRPMGVQIATGHSRGKVWLFGYNVTFFRETLHDMENLCTMNPNPLHDCLFAFALYKISALYFVENCAL